VDKPSFEEYLGWHKEQLGDDLASPELSSKFEANITVLHNTVNSHPFMDALAKRLTVLTDSGVFQESSKAPELVLRKKTFASFANKLFRLNCLWNRSWPKNPREGWITYSTSFGMLDDLIRTMLICRYLDGPERISQEIIAAANDVGLKGDTAPKATDVGYYAWHTYIGMPAQVIVADKVIDISLSVEFQATTQLQAALRELTHKFYEQDRGAVSTARSQARWDYRSPRFRAEYLGHTLHLVDAMILELRLAQDADRDGDKGVKGSGAAGT
jgi:ppGpp synthetase/RelA/SpoT-type nucleotidyltranferase